MNTENPEGKTHFGNLTTFYSLLYTSAAIFFIGLTLIFTDTHEFGLIFRVKHLAITILQYKRDFVSLLSNCKITSGPFCFTFC